mgnify:CR=1 FL=1
MPKKFLSQSLTIVPKKCQKILSQSLTIVQIVMEYSFDYLSNRSFLLEHYSLLIIRYVQPTRILCVVLACGGSTLISPFTGFFHLTRDVDCWLSNLLECIYNTMYVTRRDASLFTHTVSYSNTFAFIALHRGRRRFHVSGCRRSERSIRQLQQTRPSRGLQKILHMSGRYR